MMAKDPKCQSCGISDPYVRWGFVSADVVLCGWCALLDWCEGADK